MNKTHKSQKSLSTPFGAACQLPKEMKKKEGSRQHMAVHFDGESVRDSSDNKLNHKSLI